MSTIVTIEVNCDDTTHLYWREQGSGTWTQLSDSIPSAPTITVNNSSTVTFVFTQYSGSNEDIIYKDGINGTPKLPPQSKDVDPGETELVFFAERASSPQWYGGYVKVSAGR